ncbi:permease component of ribose/xylose/arabinose/galactoside ABC-type transporter [Rhizobium sp. CF142]|nr:permease component of ribose/xylose/arabinose/galactoside ABC-type transporter [Rhizobium sp. CF142]
MTESIGNHAASAGPGAVDSATIRRKRSFTILSARLLPILALVVVLCILWTYAPHFYRLNNLVNILLQAAVLGVLAIGMTFVMVSGGIDLSLPSAMAFGAVLGGLVMDGKPGLVPLGLLIMMSVPVAIGAFNGFAIAYLRMLPFVVTLATMTVVGGATVWITNSRTVEGFPEVFIDTLNHRPAGIPIAVLALAVLASLASVFTSRTRYGRWVYALGISEKAARVARVPAKPVLLSTYVIAGLLGGVAAILLTGRLGSASANMGADVIVLDIVSSCVVGGVSIYGGKGHPLGAVGGAIFITLISNILNALGVSFYVTLIAKGIVIILFIALDNIVRAATNAARTAR